MTPREEAIGDCRYALTLGDTALQQHFRIWIEENLERNDLVEEELQYHLTLIEIRHKMGTSECLLNLQENKV